MAKKEDLSCVAILRLDKIKLDECRKRFIKDNPEYEGIKITDYFIISRMIRWFLK